MAILLSRMNILNSPEPGYVPSLWIGPYGWCESTSGTKTLSQAIVKIRNSCADYVSCVFHAQTIFNPSPDRKLESKEPFINTHQLTMATMTSLIRQLEADCHPSSNPSHLADYDSDSEDAIRRWRSLFGLPRDEAHKRLNTWRFHQQKRGIKTSSVEADSDDISLPETYPTADEMDGKDADRLDWWETIRREKERSGFDQESWEFCLTFPPKVRQAICKREEKVWERIDEWKVRMNEKDEREREARERRDRWVCLQEGQQERRKSSTWKIGNVRAMSDLKAELIRSIGERRKWWIRCVYPMDEVQDVSKAASPSVVITIEKNVSGTWCLVTTDGLDRMLKTVALSHLLQVANAY